MKVVFLEDVAGVAQGGDVKEVKKGFARNYLIPKNLAAPAAHNALQRVDRLAKEAEATRLKTLADMKALATELDDVRVNVEMRAGTGGRLYGSVTNIIVAEELSKLTGREIDRRTIELAEPIRRLGLFDLDIHLHPEVDAKIGVLVYAMGTDPAVLLEAIEAAAETEETPSEEIVAESEQLEEAPSEEPVADEAPPEETVAEGEQPEEIEDDQSRKAEPESVPAEETLAEAEATETMEAPETESEPEEDP